MSISWGSGGISAEELELRIRAFHEKLRDAHSFNFQVYSSRATDFDETELPKGWSYVIDVPSQQGTVDVEKPMVLGQELEAAMRKIRMLGRRQMHRQMEPIKGQFRVIG